MSSFVQNRICFNTYNVCFGINRRGNRTHLNLVFVFERKCLRCEPRHVLEYYCIVRLAVSGREMEPTQTCCSEFDRKRPAGDKDVFCILLAFISGWRALLTAHYVRGRQLYVKTSKQRALSTNEFVLDGSIYFLLALYIYRSLHPEVDNV